MQTDRQLALLKISIDLLKISIEAGILLCGNGFHAMIVALTRRLGAHQDHCAPKLDAIIAIIIPGRADQDFLGRGVPPVHFQNAAVRARKSARSIPFEKNARAALEIFLVKHALMERAVPPSSIQRLKALSA